jgi:gamma-glutamyl hercynylcysteine S-oxide synthase
MPESARRTTTNLPGELGAARSLTDNLFDLLVPGALFDRPIPDRHRLIFYFGHLEAFDWNLLARYALGEPSFEPRFDRLFAFGIDPEPGKAPRDTQADWPEIATVREYNERTRDVLDGLMAEIPGELLLTAIEHRLMHGETLCYLFHNLPPERKRQPEGVRDLRTGGVAPQEMIPIPGGWATLGCRQDDGFGWDNEFGEFRVEVPEFRIQRFQVTNGEYLRFVEAGGPVPHYWRQDLAGWRQRTMFGESPLLLDHPVYVTHSQAEAYAEWCGYALPSEGQWHRAAYGTPQQHERSFPWGSESPECAAGNFDSRRWDTEPVSASDGAESAFGVSGLLGNGWEWTSSVFEPFPGFQPRPYYPGYSADFFDGAHYVMKGGSPRTAARLLRRSFRNWFRPDYPYVYAGFRCIDMHI